MACEHKRIMSRNCVLYCMDCGAKVDGAKVDAPKPGEKKPEPKRPARKKKE